MAGCKSGLDPFILNNNFATTMWNRPWFFSLNYSESFIISHNFFVARDETDVLKSSPNIVMHYSNCLTISTSFMLPFISMYIPKKVCLFPLTTDRYTFFLKLVDDIWYFWWFFLWHFLSSKYQAILNCVHSIILFATNLSHVFISKHSP